jgi:hypothetical protein
MLRAAARTLALDAEKTRSPFSEKCEVQGLFRLRRTITGICGKQEMPFNTPFT